MQAFNIPRAYSISAGYWEPEGFHSMPRTTVTWFGRTPVSSFFFPYSLISLSLGTTITWDFHETLVIFSPRWSEHAETFASRFLSSLPPQQQHRCFLTISACPTHARRPLGSILYRSNQEHMKGRPSKWEVRSKRPGEDTLFLGEWENEFLELHLESRTKSS